MKVVPDNVIKKKSAVYNIHAIGVISVTKSVKEPIGVLPSWPRFVENGPWLSAMVEMFMVIH